MLSTALRLGPDGREKPNALWLGGLITVIAGYFAGRRMRKAHLQEETAGA